MLEEESLCGPCTCHRQSSRRGWVSHISVISPVASERKVKNSPLAAPWEPIPPCACGSPRHFEFQVLPSLLHVLEVDKHHFGSVDASYAEGALDFGNLAVYTCAGSCDAEAFVVVQAEETPLIQRRTVDETPAVIAEDAQFDLDEPFEEEDGDE